MTDLDSTHYPPGVLAAQATDAVVIRRDRSHAIGTIPPSATADSIGAALEALLIDGGMRDLLSAVEATFGIMEIVEDEICAAQRRHGEIPPVRDDSGKIVGTKGPLWRSFRLLRPTGVMADRAEFVYRAHCKELLDRVERAELRLMQHWAGSTHRRFPWSGICSQGWCVERLPARLGESTARIIVVSDTTLW